MIDETVIEQPAIRSPRIRSPRIRALAAEVRTRPLEHVEFVCPRCGGDRSGVVLEAQRWFCLLGVRVVPSAMLDPMVECEACGHRSSTAVLEVLTSAALTACLAEAMRRSVASVVRAGIGDGHGMSPDVLDAVLDVMITGGYEYDEFELAGDLAAAGEDVVRTALRPLVDELTPRGKQSFLHRMLAIALADGPLGRGEQRALVQIGVELGMAAPHINGVIATAAIRYRAAA